MHNSESIEDSLILKEASESFIVAYRKTDKYCNSPIRSKYLSQNYLDNYLLIEGICKNMRLNPNLSSLVLCGIRLSMESMNILSETLIKCRSIKEFTMNFCLLDISLVEALMPGLCQNRSIETVNLSCNGLDDRCSYLISKIVSSQGERRDNIVWTYSLRGELPPSNEYKEGLKQIILTHNSFSDVLASELVIALRNDVYMRSVDLRCNMVSERWVVEFAKLLRTNKTLTNVDLRENVGLTTKHHRNIALSLLSNI
jgi:hypothetical protein